MSADTADTPSEPMDIDSPTNNTSPVKDTDQTMQSNGNDTDQKDETNTQNTAQSESIIQSESIPQNHKLPNTNNNTQSKPIINGTHTPNSQDTPTQSQPQPRKVRKIGYDENGQLMPGFEDVNDDQLCFSSESDFAIFIKQISSEIPLQRLVAVKRMIKSCHLWGVEAVRSVLPRVKQLSCDKEMVIRQAIAEVLGPFAKYLTEESEKSDSDIESANKTMSVIVNELLPLIKEMLKDAMEVRQGAGSSLIIIAELLSKEQVYEHILKIVLHMAHDDSDDQKITALPLLGDLAPIVGSAVCKNYLSADLHALSQDNSFRVRKATVQYFGPICQQLSSDDCSECLLPIFLSLCSDSIWSVRKGCVESFVDVSSSINSTERIKLIPIMEKFLNDSSRWVRNTAYEILGPFISTLDSENISTDFLKYFTSIPHLSSAEADADCTNHCAFNFPAVVLTVGSERWNELNDTYNILCRKTFKSRKTLACSIHEIASVLGPELTEKYLLNSIEFFLKDIDDIRQGIIRNLWKTLRMFSSKLRVEYVSILWELASESDVNWRFRLLLAQQLDEILYLYEAKLIKEQIMPLIFQLCQDRMADVRYAAVYPIADAINILSKESNADTESGSESELDSITTRIQTIYKGRTYSKRLLYIRIADSCFERIPQQTFDCIFLKDLLNYANDQIFNVRFCLARFIHDRLLQSTKYDYESHDLVTKAITVLRNDDEDVEIKRFFMGAEQVNNWVRFKKAQRREQESLENNGSENMRHLAATNGGMNDKKSDLDSTDSSLYSSSDSDNPDSDSLDEDLDDGDDDSDDKLKAVSQELSAMSDSLQKTEKENEQLSNMDISVLGTNQLTEKEKTVPKSPLQHQDTPFELNISPELKEEIELEASKNSEDTNNTGNYGLPPKDETHTNNASETAMETNETIEDNKSPTDETQTMAVNEAIET